MPRPLHTSRQLAAIVPIALATASIIAIKQGSKIVSVPVQPSPRRTAPAFSRSQLRFMRAAFGLTSPAKVLRRWKVVLALPTGSGSNYTAPLPKNAARNAKRQEKKAMVAIMESIGEPTALLASRKTRRVCRWIMRAEAGSENQARALQFSHPTNKEFRPLAA